MSTKKHVSRSRKKVNLLQNRLDFHVPEKKVDSSKSKNISTTKIMEERELIEGAENEDEECSYEDWEERVEDDDNNNANPSGTKTLANRKCTAAKRKKYESASTQGRIYPPDLWFLIGKHVKPESVQTFSLICRDSCTVVRTYQFWVGLYQRTFEDCRRMNSSECLEEELQVSCVIRPLGVKYHVIRALFKIYPPFKEMLERQKLNSIDFDFLIGYKCSKFWMLSPAKSVFMFYVQLDRPESTGPADKTSLFNDTSKAVMYNPYEDSTVLQINCDRYVSIKSPMGLHVVDIKYNTSRDMRNMRLELGLSTTQNSYASKRQEEETKVFDPVSSVRVLPWWHPNFPTIVKSKIPEGTRIEENWESFRLISIIDD